ncbi:hypothetical protein A2943_01455 [Candidatus Adlerbacteria bacterium RIFCSPLOWO2_01_FULL_51_16]|uniref:HTH deoR-type domain-containing protein n=1 Tax=Candidatus Adlerbacteria bacterium RIFCSPLOWO2_01_FULL_51_16 TaxID=1797243 RepID=A0A1F4XHB0_9BACT|nr:MAG: hypothetical protein A2943_01455 [Candidatus Adlerbacteria bacterium RIFCSPLOWO2_01_FULL_51_16]
MSDIHKKFHEFALQSALFKGRSDWYFCYLKAEKIAHVLSRLADATPGESAPSMHKLARTASKLPESVVRFVAGELEQGSVLADIFTLLSAVRFASTEGNMSSQNALLLVEEYEHIAEKLGASGQPSPFVSSEDFSVPPLPAQMNISLPARALSLKDKVKGQSKGHPQAAEPLGGKQADLAQREIRLSRILEAIRTLKSASIRDISAVVKEYGEKTIQRELLVLIEQGLVRKVGERRWSVYTPVSGI